MPHRELIRRAALVLQGGGVIAYPTEAVFGLGCDPENPAPVARILELKQRHYSAGLILVAARFEQVQHLVEPLEGATEERVMATWPGPQTWLLPAREHCPAWLTGEHESLAVRVSNHPVVRALCEAADMAIVSTSANRSGRPPARSALACRMRFGASLDLVVPGRTGGQARPTAIRDAVTGRSIRAA